MLSEEQIQRYARQIILPELGPAGQRKLSQAKALCVGVGGLGSPAALYVAAAGVGTLGLVDPDPVELSNLHRQILHSSSDLGRPKVFSAKAKLQALEPRLSVKAHPFRLEPANIAALFSEYDVVLDGSDNFETRYMVNDTCVRLGIPLVSGAVMRWEGQVMTVLPKKSPCYRCAFPESPEPGCAQSCSEAGVLGALCGVIGSLQAAEAVKTLLGRSDLLTGRLLIFDLLNMRMREKTFRKNPGCSACGTARPLDSPVY